MTIPRKSYPKGTVYGRGECPACGATCQIKASTKGLPYMICNHTDELGEPCNSRFFWGAREGAKIINQYHDARKRDAKGKNPDRGAATGPETRPETRPDTGPGVQDDAPDDTGTDTGYDTAAGRDDGGFLA